MPMSRPAGSATDQLSRYIEFSAGRPPRGLLIDFVEKHQDAFQSVFETVHMAPPVTVPATASVDRYALLDPRTRIGENVLVAQRALLQNAWLGRGANAQENCYLVNCRLEGPSVTAHGAEAISLRACARADDPAPS